MSHLRTPSKKPVKDQGRIGFLMRVGARGPQRGVHALCGQPLYWAEFEQMTMHDPPGCPAARRYYALQEKGITLTRARPPSKISEPTPQ